MTDNAFEQYGWSSVVASTRRTIARQFKREQDAPMMLTAAEKRQRDQERMLRSHKRWYREQYREQLMGPHGAHWRSLARVLRSLTIDNSRELIEHVRCSPLRSAIDRDTRYLALALISKAIVRLRTRNGYPPFDDALPGEEPTAYEIIRDLLTYPEK